MQSTPKNKKFTKEIEQIEFEWRIFKYSSITSVESDLFKGKTGDTIWSMRLKKTRGWLSVTVQRVDSKLRNISGSIRVSLRNHRTGELSNEYTKAVQFAPSELSSENGRSTDSNNSAFFDYDFSHLIRDHLLCNDEELLQNDQMLIVCEILTKTQPIPVLKCQKDWEHQIIEEKKPKKDWEYGVIEVKKHRKNWEYGVIQEKKHQEDWEYGVIEEKKQQKGWEYGVIQEKKHRNDWEYGVIEEIEYNGSENELDRSQLSPDSGTFEEHDRENRKGKHVSFDLTQFEHDLTSEINKLTDGLTQYEHELRSEYNKLTERLQHDHDHGDDGDEQLVEGVHFEYEHEHHKDSSGEQAREDQQHEGDTSDVQENDNFDNDNSSSHHQLIIDTSDEFVHCKLISGDCEVDAYKSVSPLAAEREIFSAMFTKKSELNNGHRATVDEIDQQVMIELSRFTLSGKVLNLEQLADRLFIAANKYGIDELKEICANALCEGINGENVCARLILADQHHHTLALLKTAAIEYFKRNLNHVENFNGYSDLLADHPALVAQIFISLSDQ